VAARRIVDYDRHALLPLQFLVPAERGGQDAWGGGTAVGPTAAAARRDQGARWRQDGGRRSTGWSTLLAGGLHEQRKPALVKALGASSAQQAFAATGGDADARLRSTLHLLMSSPEYQVC
jgi:hypothetical protein